MESLFITFLEISLTASVMLLIVMAVRVLFSKRMSPAVVVALWGLVLLRLCVPFTIESPLHIGSLFPPPIEQTVAVDAGIQSPTPSFQPNISANFAPPDSGQMSKAETAAPVMEKAVSIPAIPWWSVLAGVWLTGAAAVLTVTFIQGIAFRHRIKGYQKVCAEPVCGLISRHKQMLRLKRAVIAVECDDLSAPAVFGFFKPVILLPRKFLKMDSQTLSCILLHELCHIKRRDVLKCYAWLVVKALHWFNPLVWLAFHMVKDDIELCCDDAVTRRLEPDSRYAYTQALIDVFRMAKQSEPRPVTVSLFESRAKLTHRVKRMLKPERRLKSTVVISAVLAIVMAIAGFTTACSQAVQTQPTIVKMEAQETAQQTPAPLPSVQPTTSPTLSYDAPAQWKDSFGGDNGLLTVNVNAAVVLPSVEKIPTYHVEPDAAFSQELADKFVSLLFGDDPVYQMSNPTKQMLQKEIENISSDYAAMQSGTFDFMDNIDDDAKQVQAENLKAYLDRLQEQLKTAADASTLVPLDTRLNVDQYGMSTINGMADLGRDEWADFQLANHSNSGSSVYFHNDGGYTVQFCDGITRKAPIGDLTISEAEARRQADELLGELGLSDFVCCSGEISGKSSSNDYYVMEDRYAHMLIYSRNLGGISLAPSRPAYLRPMDYTQYVNYQPEHILITVNDQGICDFQWTNRIQVGDIAEPSVKLMPFGDISELIKQKIVEQCTGVADSLSNEIGHGENWWKTDAYILNIDRIVLEYAWMPVNGDPTVQMIVPVWNVYGSTEWWFWKEVDGEKVKDSVIDSYSRVMLTLSALDGSVL